jgi:hypothetical protein
LIDALRADIAHAGERVRCLIKGSRGSRMDRVVSALLEREESQEAPHAA